MRIGKTIWHSKRINSDNEEVAQYEAPKSYVTRPNYLTVMPASSRGFMTMMQYGEDLDNTWTMIANSMAFDGVFSVGDLIWVDGESPIESLEKEYGNGASSNAIVKSCVEINHSISITLTRNKNQVKK